jgi:hypothetical protein
VSLVINILEVVVFEGGLREKRSEAKRPEQLRGGSSWRFPPVVNTVHI